MHNLVLVFIENFFEEFNKKRAQSYSQVEKTQRLDCNKHRSLHAYKFSAKLTKNFLISYNVARNFFK